MPLTSEDLARYDEKVCFEYVEAKAPEGQGHVQLRLDDWNEECETQ